MAACVVLTTVADRRAALKLAKPLVERHLAACVGVIPGAMSLYRWKGRVQTSREALLLVKTSRRLWPKVLNYIKKSHPYEVPEIILLPIVAGSKEYLSWLNASLKK